ncbi:MAG: hypothetical protein ACREMO_05075 [Gemmatimonadales bacterium]
MLPALSAPSSRRLLGAAGVLVGVLAGGCGERDRLTFQSPGDSVGPVSTIDRPGQDTTVTAGPGFLVTGTTVDSDGVDTVYFQTIGGVSNFPPFAASTDTVRFGLPVTTNGQSGQTITVTVFGVDRLGNRGNSVSRQLVVQ